MNLVHHYCLLIQHAGGLKVLSELIMALSAILDECKVHLHTMSVMLGICWQWENVEGL